jgi:uncharacterized protein (TIGR02453 family)
LTKSDHSTFAGFSPQAPEFLRDLAADNRKEWFEAHRDEYATFLQAPLRHLAADLSAPLLAIDPELTTLPNKVVSRIHRDTRFSRDKSPYKTTMWLTFKRPLKEWQDAPVFFFELSRDSWRYGMGFYAASRETMDALRRMIDMKPGEFRKAVAFLENQDRFIVEGESYRRLLRNGLPPDLESWYQRKSFYLVCNRQNAEVLFGPNLLSELSTGFSVLAPFYHWLWKQRIRRA